MAPQELANAWKSERESWAVKFRIWKTDIFSLTNLFKWKHKRWRWNVYFENVSNVQVETHVFKLSEEISEMNKKLIEKLWKVHIFIEQCFIGLPSAFS